MKKLILAATFASLVFASCTPASPTSTLTAPRVSTEAKDIESPAFGKAEAKVEVKIFSDYQCPACQRFHSLIEPKLRSEYADAGKISLVYKNYPLPQHQNAEGDAVAGMCALSMGKYLEFSEGMYALEGTKTNADVTDAERIEVAKAAGIADLAEFGKCLSENWYLSRISKDRAEGDRLGLDHTPSAYFNDQIVDFKSVEEFFAILDASLSAAK
ncbi:MAG: hypothetical protein QG650_157 [Patescibacteria group bacterium]|nr:hypothetical protein [Patescibacteria group bacterium]